jgi:pyruvate formate lyase activating enzyme
MSDPSLVSAPERAALEAVRGVVFDVQRYSLHDGPGLRTNVFLKGCPLRCGWCANPESQALQPEPMLRAAHCIECGEFAEPCTHCWPLWQAQRKRNGQSVKAAVAAEIDARAAVCPTGALGWVGTWRTAGDVLAEVLRDRPFYGAGGGVTLTGGEPTVQPDFAVALLRLARLEGIGTALETCGHAPWATFTRLLPHLDLLLFDVKHADPARHRAHTGLDNALILDNLRRAVEAGAAVRVRVPLIPGFNASDADVAAIAALVRGLPGHVQGMDLLPYHTMGRAKYAALGREYPWPEQKRLPQAEAQRLAQIVERYGLPVAVGG